MIIRNEIPILEYDDSSSEVIPPDHDWTGDLLPEKCLFAFLGDVVHKYARTHDSEAAQTLVTVSHDIVIYVLHEDGEDICLVQSPIGASASAQLRMPKSDSGGVLRRSGRYRRECFYCSKQGAQGRGHFLSLPAGIKVY